MLPSINTRLKVEVDLEIIRNLAENYYFLFIYFCSDDFYLKCLNQTACVYASVSE